MYNRFSQPSFTLLCTFVARTCALSYDAFLFPSSTHGHRYNEKEDERRATNLMISCRADFTDIQVTRLGPLSETHGFSSFKFVPGTKDEVIVAIKSEENGDNLGSCILQLLCCLTGVCDCVPLRSFCCYYVK